MSKLKKIAFVIPYPHGEAPSQRFRFEQYYTFLKQEDYRFKTYSFYSKNTWRIMYAKGKYLQKIVGVFFSFLKRMMLFFQLIQFQYVFIHREVLPFGFPFFEWFIAKVLRKKIIFDFDDAIWKTDEKARLSNVIRCFWKVKYICKWSYKVSCGNQYLVDYASQWNNNVVLNPTTIDTEYHKYDKIYDNDLLPVIGWTGSHSTLKYLDVLIPVLKQLENEIKLLVICNYDPGYDLKNYEFVQWSEEIEIETLARMDVGVMPLPNDEWTKGKCGFKALQYMALKKPVIISPVGVNKDIITDRTNGFLASSDKEWLFSIKELVSNKSLAKEIGEAGFETVKNKYSVLSNKQQFLNLFN